MKIKQLKAKLIIAKRIIKERRLLRDWLKDKIEEITDECEILTTADYDTSRRLFHYKEAYKKVLERIN